MKRKHILALSLLLLKPIAAEAAEKTDTKVTESQNSSNFGKLTFFPEQNTFLNDFSLSYTEDKFTVKVPFLGTTINTDVKEKTTAANESIEYSFLPNQEIGLAMSYASATGTATLGNTSADGKASGFTNPTLLYRYRFMKQSERPFNLDFYGTFSPDLIEKKDGTTKDNGTVASGKNVFAVGTLLSGEQGAFVWSVNPELVYNGEEKAKDATSGVTTKTDSYVSFSLDGSGQYFFNSMIAADFGLGFAYIPETTSTTDGDSAITVESRIVSQVKIGVDAIVIPNKLDIYLTLTGSAASDADAKQSGNKVATISDQTGSSAILGAKVSL